MISTRKSGLYRSAGSDKECKNGESEGNQKPNRECIEYPEDHERHVSYSVHKAAEGKGGAGEDKAVF